jgi:hypothetical protein
MFGLDISGKNHIVTWVRSFKEPEKLPLKNQKIIRALKGLFIHTGSYWLGFSCQMPSTCVSNSCGFSRRQLACRTHTYWSRLHYDRKPVRYSGRTGLCEAKL